MLLEFGTLFIAFYLILTTLRYVAIKMKDSEVIYLRKIVFSGFCHTSIKICFWFMQYNVFTIITCIIINVYYY